MTEQFLHEIALSFIEPIGKRSAYTASRLAVLKDGSTRPVLLLLAERKFGTWPEEKFPFWLDGDRTNETLENVDLATRPSRPTAPSGKRAKNPYGAPAGSREYMRRWRTANRERVNASQKTYAANRRAAVAAASEPVDVAQQDDALFSKLDALIEKNSKTSSA